RHPIPEPAGAPHAPQGAAVRNSWCSCVFQPLLDIPVMRFPHHSRYSLTRFNGDWLIDHALLFGVVADFNKPGERKILAKRMADKAIVGQDASQIGMPGEHDSEQVESLALEPVRRRPDAYYGIHNRELVVGGECLQTQSMIQ